ncbi:efflux transporter outer membrane subunit [Methylomonas sp. MS20]|uniref:efflux transporter outer membrane subunit n=1 Tax=unclassified Methylomonas TaxID=2608980 RepID=UPI0028A403B7|nr:efflux transporter outer membrane subunit [Methylomonas sp. MV1]MDT4332612.1 efflux transporter outer membrane subunit [Methylomonas sp. MV1]
MKLAGWVWIVALAGLGGCARFGDSRPAAEKISLPPMTQTLRDAQTGAWPVSDWWRQFGSPELNRLIETALADNPDLGVAAARLRQARALVDGQAAALYPTVSANVAFSAQRFSANSVQAKLAGEQFRQLLIDPVVLRYHLDLWGRDRAELQQAVDGALASAAELTDARLMLAGSVARAYFDLVAAEQQRLVGERLLDSRRRLLVLEARRRDSGLSGDALWLNTQIDLGESEASLAAAGASVELGRHLLAALAGRGPDWGADIRVEHAAPAWPGLPADLPLHLLARRPDVSAARLRAEAAAEAVHVAQTEFYPDVNLIGLAGLHSVSLTDVVFHGSSLAYAVGPSLTFPLFEGGRLRANLADSEAGYDAAVEFYNATLSTAAREVVDAVSRGREALATAEALVQNLADAERTKRVADILRQTGLSDAAGPLQAAVVVDRLHWRIATAQAARAKAVVALCEALGGGFQEDQVLSVGR